MKGGSSLDYFKQRRAYRNLKMYEIAISNGQNNLYRELLDYANDQGKLDSTFPMKNSALLSLTGLSEAGIKKARNELSQLGLIKYIPGRKNSYAPKYQIIKLYKDTFRATTTQKSSPESTDKVAQMVTQPVAQTVAHKELTNTDTNLTNTDKHNVENKRSTKLEGQVREIIAYLNSKTDKHFKEKSKDTVRLISGRIHENYTVDDFKKVIDIKTPQWQGTSYDKFLRPATLFAPGHFDAYLNERPVKQNELNFSNDTPRDFGGSTRYRHEVKPEPIRSPQKGDEPF